MPNLLLWSVVFLASANASTAETTPTYTLRSSRTAGDIDRVEVSVEVGGELKVLEEGQPARLQTSLAATLFYDEKTLESAADQRRAVRSYTKAEGTLQVDGNTFRPSIRDDRRLISAEQTEKGLTLFSPEGPLTRDELDLIELVGDSLLLDDLLPADPVAPGTSWKHADALMARLLTLDAVKQSDVASKLLEVVGTTARLEFAGKVSGAIGGVATEMEVTGKYQFDLRQRRIIWFGLLIKEDRAIGHVGPGVAWVAKLQTAIRPSAASPELADAALEGLTLTATPGLTQIVHRSPEGAWEFHHDRGWYVVSDSDKLAVLQRIDRGELVAQCKISTLPDVAQSSDLSLSRFQEDIKRALGEHFERFARANQQVNAAGYREYCVVAEGSVPVAAEGEEGKLPIQWAYYLLMDRYGRQVALTFVVEGSLLERFAAADEQLVANFRLSEPDRAAQAAPAAQTHAK